MHIIECEQYDDAWWAARRGVPTCSEFHRLLTAKTRKLASGADGYIRELIADRMEQRPNFFKENAQTRDMAEGTAREPEARRYYEMERNVDVLQVGFVLDDETRFGGSPDGLVGEEGGLELKCPKLATHIGYLLDGGLPEDYKAQVHGHLIITKRKWWDFMSYAPPADPLIVRVLPDDFTHDLKVAMEVFWGKYVATWKRIKGEA